MIIEKNYIYFLKTQHYTLSKRICGEKSQIHSKYKWWLVRVTVKYLETLSYGNREYECALHIPIARRGQITVYKAVLLGTRGKCFKHSHKTVHYLYVGILMYFNNILKTR